MTIAVWRRATSTLTATALMMTGAAIASGSSPASASVQSELQSLADADYAEGYAALVKTVMPAVVAVRVEREGDPETAMRGGTPDMREFFERFFGMPGMPDMPPPPERPQRDRPMVGLGSGFIISADGLVVTNAHVVGAADRVEVRLDDERIYEARVQGVDELTDLALLKIEADEPLPYVRFGDSDGVEVGDKVLAIGNPFGLGGTVTSGIVSALGRRIGSGPYDDFLQIDAPINRGNSGGPTFDLQGDVVGVNTAIFSPSGGSIGIGFAISANLAQEVIADLQDDGEVSRGWLGVGIQELDDALARQFGLDPATEGTVVTQVQPLSPAERAGFRTGDVITRLNGEVVPGPNALSRRVAALDPGSEATLTVIRDGSETELEVSLGERPAPGMTVGEAAPDEQGPGPRLGLALAPLDDAARGARRIEAGRGVLVAAVEPGSAAAEAGVRRGDVILQVGRTDVATPAEVQEEVSAAVESGSDTVLMLLNRDGAQRFTTVPIEVS